MHCCRTNISEFLGFNIGLWMCMQLINRGTNCNNVTMKWSEYYIFSHRQLSRRYSRVYSEVFGEDECILILWVHKSSTLRFTRKLATNKLGKVYFSSRIFSLLSLRKKVTMLFVWVRAPSFQFLRRVSDFHETWYELYVIGSCLSAIRF
jgi:hypothetical protein